MNQQIEVFLKQERDFRFAIDFGGGIPVLHGDETLPRGSGIAPTSVQLLAAAVENCLSDRLFFTLQKFKQDAQGIATKVSATVGRNT